MNESLPNRRRDFLKAALSLSAGAALSSCGGGGSRFQISLAQWSNHVALKAGEMDPLDWPQHTRENFDIGGLEYVNQFYYEQHDRLGFQPKSEDHFNELNKRAADNGMTNLLIMCDRVGNLGNPDEQKRADAIEGHYAWCDRAKQLGCHSIRVNAASDGSLPKEEQAKHCADGLFRLADHARFMDLNVIVENHGGYSSDGAWLAGVMKEVGLESCGTLPDFGNFYLAKNRGKAEQYEKAKAPYADGDYVEDETGLQYDRYQGIKDLMPFAKGVSAKSHDFDEAGNEIHTDFAKAMQIVADSGYSGYVGIEYEGKELSEIDGIKATKALLERVFEQI